MVEVSPPFFWSNIVSMVITQSNIILPHCYSKDIEMKDEIQIHFTINIWSDYSIYFKFENFIIIIPLQ